MAILNKKREGIMIKEWTCQLYDDFEYINHTYRLNLPTPLILVEPMGNALGCFDAADQSIHIAEGLIQKHTWDIVFEILKHEVAHFFADYYCGSRGHDQFFHKACERIFVADWARKARVDPGISIETHRYHKPTEQEAQILRKIEKLLALAGSSNEHESLAAMRKVQELQLKFNLNRVRENQTERFDYIIINHRKKRLELYQRRICGILINFFQVRVINSHLYDAYAKTEYRVCEVLGTPRDIKIAEYVYWFLYNNLPILWRQYQEVNPWVQAKSKGSFYLGVIDGFYENLKQPRDKVRSTPSQQSDLDYKGLMVIKDKQLENYVNKRYPSLRTSTDQSNRFFDSSSYSAGQVEGKNLRLHKGIAHNHNGFGGYLG